MKSAFQLVPLLCSALSILCGCQSAPLHKTPSTDAAQPAVGTATPQTTASAGTDASAESLISLNSLFLDAYRQRQIAVKTNTSPVIVANFSSLVLYWHGAAETNRCIPDVYQALKAVSHVPFGIFLLLEPCTTSQTNIFPAGLAPKLTSYLDRIGQAEAFLPSAGLSPSQLARQRWILSQCKTYLQKELVAPGTSRQELLSFARQLGPLMLANANDAAAVELELTHAVVMRWKHQLPPNDWKRLVVVVRGPQMPRRLNVLTQYFARILGEPSHGLGYPLESRHLIYAESIPNNRDHLDLMATTFIDGDASEAFFGDRWRMSRDVLADGAAAYLKKLRFD